MIQTMTITMRLPDKTLSPNRARGSQYRQREHRKAKRQAKTAAFALALARRGRQGVERFRTAEVTPRFFWPNMIKRDHDNAIASIKAIIDGITEAVMVGDDNSRDLRLGAAEFYLDRECPRLEIEIKGMAEPA